MAHVRPTMLRWLVIAPLLVGLGVVLGQWLPRGNGRVWQGPAAVAPSPVVGAPPSLAPVVRLVGPSVVTVRALLPLDAEQDEVLPEPGEARGRVRGVRNGSGFIVHADGLVVTSRHIVADASSILVRVPDQRRRFAQLVGEDPITDIAVLRLQDPPPGLRALELGRSEDLQAGDWIVTVGNPFDFSQTVTVGVVSFVGRHLQHYDTRVTNDFLQFSAPVNPGSSGSPVLDLQGRVVGVTTQAPESGQGISFAIPSRTLKWVLDELQHSPDGRIRRGYAGMTLGTAAPTDRNGNRLEGALITGIARGAPGATAGLQPGDVVLRCDDQPVSDGGMLHEIISRSRPGRTVLLTVVRDGQTLPPIPLTLDEVTANRGPAGSGD